MKKISLTISCLIFCIVAGFSQQQKHAFGIAWEVNSPNNSGYLTKTSWSGGKLEYRYFLKPNLSVGGAMDWASYSQYFSRQTYTKADGNTAITSDFVAHIYTLPIMATTHYYFEQKAKMRMFVGLGLGAQYMEQRLFYNVYETYEYNWGFVGRPEFGILIGRPESHSPILLAINYGFATNENGITKKSSFNSFGVTLGVLLK